MPDDLTDQVRAAAEGVVQTGRIARIDDAAIRRWADHYKASEAGHGESPLDRLGNTPAEVANLTLLADALNFCFWSERPIQTTWRGRTVERHSAFLVLLAEAIRSDPAWLRPQRWLEATEKDFLSMTVGAGVLLMPAMRAAVVQETGRVLLDEFGGSGETLAATCGGDCVRLAATLFERFASFHDAVTHDGRVVPFAKRAQIFAADLALAWRTRGWETLTGLERLTAFADYRIPQILRHLGIIELDAEVSARIERREEIAAASLAEIEIRAATIVAVERMVQALAERGRAVPAWRVDFDLWKQSHDGPMRFDHHRTHTCFY